MNARFGSARREEEAVVRSDVAAHLEHDLGVRPEPKRARIASAADAVDVYVDRAAKGQEPPRSQRLTPDTEEAAERCAALIVDDAARVECPKAGTAAGVADAAEATARPVQPDRRRHDHYASSGEQLEVNTRPIPKRRRAAGEVRSRRTRGRVVPRTGSDRCRHKPQQSRRRPERERPQGHRRQATRIALCALACALTAGIAASVARADGDPASDYLVSQPVFLSYDAKIPPALQSKLVAAVTSANKNGFPLKVALIWSRYDLGSVPELFGKPKTYARFLDAEDSKCWWGGSCGSGRFKTTTRLLVVMPNGLGFAQWKHSPAAGYRTLAGIKVTRTPAGLATAATTAVVKLAAAAGVKVSTNGGSTPAGKSNGGGTSRIEIIAAVVTALLIGAAARFLIRRRAARSALR
jgi:hypothetical protein